MRSTEKNTAVHQAQMFSRLHAGPAALIAVVVVFGWLGTPIAEAFKALLDGGAQLPAASGPASAASGPAPA